jgi:hypothetical protein
MLVWYRDRRYCRAKEMFYPVGAFIGGSFCGKGAWQRKSSSAQTCRPAAQQYIVTDAANSAKLDLARVRKPKKPSTSPDGDIGNVYIVS